MNKVGEQSAYYTYSVTIKCLFFNDSLVIQVYIRLLCKEYNSVHEIETTT